MVEGLVSDRIKSALTDMDTGSVRSPRPGSPRILANLTLGDHGCIASGLGD